MIRRKIIDVTGTPLTPSYKGRKCLGNGEHPPYECCCDECNYYLKCYPDCNWWIKKTMFKHWVKYLFKKFTKKSRLQ